MVELLLQNGAEVDCLNLQCLKFSPLYGACIKGHFEVAKLLIMHGADVNFKEKGNYFALHMASQEGHYEIVKLLLKNGATVDCLRRDGLTPLHLACSIGHAGVRMMQHF